MIVAVLFLYKIASVLKWLPESYWHNVKDTTIFFYLEAKSCVDGPFLKGGHCIDNIPIPGFTCNCPYTYHGIICEKGK